MLGQETLTRLSLSIDINKVLEETIMAKEEKIIALGKKAAYNLADVTKTRPQYGAITPKWP